jgi:hypothetical protein
VAKMGLADAVTYVRRQPEKTALYRVMQEHLLTFEQQWADEASGCTLPKFVTGEHHVVAFTCKARAVCPSCLGRLQQKIGDVYGRPRKRATRSCTKCSLATTFPLGANG